MNEIPGHASNDERIEGHPDLGYGNRPTLRARCGRLIC
jgi:hypothetical protein